MRNFDLIPPEQFSLLAALLGLLLAEDLDVSEQNAMGNFFLTLGQTTLTNAAQSENQKNHNINNKELWKQIDNLTDQLEDLKKQLRH
jgi:hypothetical protein